MPGHSRIAFAQRSVGSKLAVLLATLAGLTPFALVPVSAAAQAETEGAGAEAEASEGEWAVLPFLTYTPETGLGGGVVAGYYRRLAPEEPSSTFLGTFQATARGHFIVEWSPDVYLSDTRLDGRIEGSRFPDVFYGVGPGAAEDEEEDYTSNYHDDIDDGQLMASLMYEGEYTITLESVDDEFETVEETVTLDEDDETVSVVLDGATPDTADDDEDGEDE